MNDWSSNGSDWRPDDEEDGSGERSIEIRVVTPMPVPLRLELIERDEVREGERAYATYIAGDGAPDRPIAVNSLPAELVDSLLASELFAEPRHIMASIHEEDGGLRGLMSALVPADQVERWAREQESEGEPAEPWRASIPETPSFEHTMDEGADEEHATAVVPIPLGIILRFAENRRHRDDVVREAADLVESVLGGFGIDAKQKRIDDLLGGI
jgi:hypothetical protein